MIILKRCSKCQKTLSLEHFHKNKTGKHGVRTICKKCCNAYSARHYEKNKDHYKKRIAEYRKNHKEEYKKYPSNSRECRRKCERKYHSKNREKRNKESLIHYYKNQQRYDKVYKGVERAIKKGILVKENCVICDDINTYAHHEDYNKPLDVIWLCPKHHAQLHHGENSGKLYTILNNTDKPY